MSPIALTVVHSANLNFRIQPDKKVTVLNEQECQPPDADIKARQTPAYP